MLPKGITQQNSPTIEASYVDVNFKVASSSSKSVAQAPIYTVIGIQTWDRGSDVPVELRMQMYAIDLLFSVRS